MALIPGRRFSRRHLGLFAVGCAALLVLACGGGGDDSAEATAPETAAATTPGAPATSPAEGTQVITFDEEGVAVSNFLPQGTLPNEYPSDLPPPPDAAAQKAMLIPEQGGMVNFRTNQSVDGVLEHYQSAMDGAGYSTKREDAPQRSVVKGEKSGRSVTVVANENAGGTDFVVTFEGS